MGIFKNILGTEKIVDSVGEIIDGVVTNKEEKLNAKAKIKEIMNSYKIEVEKNITARWEADANGNVLTRSVRPLVLGSKVSLSKKGLSSFCTSLRGLFIPKGTFSPSLVLKTAISFSILNNVFIKLVFSLLDKSLK